MKKIIITLIVLLSLTACNKITYKTIDAKEAKKMMENQENLVIDVRSKAEYNQGHIKNAISIPLDNIDDVLTRISDKKTTLLLYCQSGKRALEAANYLANQGYENIYTFGGIDAWPYEVIK